MGKYNLKGEWVAPIFIILAILAIWLALEYLPLSSWGINFDTSTLWTYMPWLIAFALGLYTLKYLIFKRR
jgi:hypothetical protein